MITVVTGNKTVSITTGGVNPSVILGSRQLTINTSKIPDLQLSTPVLLGNASGSSSASLSWGNITNNNGYTLERSLNQSDWTEIPIGQDIVIYNDSGLSSETTYYYRIKAIAVSPNTDSEYSNTVTITTAAPGTGIGSMAIGSTFIVA